MSADTFALPDVNQAIQLPNGTPISSILPAFAVPASTASPKIDTKDINVPASTETVE